MATIRVSTFNKELIRSYVQGTDVLDAGIAYMKRINPALSDEQAKELAIQQTQKFCQQKWQNDSTGYISNEYIAFQEFSDSVRKGHYFNSSTADYSSIADGPDWFMLIICFFFGMFGVHRFIDGRFFTGLLWLMTGGCFVIGWIVDLVNIWRGEF